jgi:hypothetical protein
MGPVSMTQHDGSDDTPIDIATLPDWTPKPVRDAIQTIEQQDLSFGYPILKRLAFDARMKKVWSELLKRKSGQFAHQARPRDESDFRTNDELQAGALRELILYVIIVSFEKRPVAKPKEIEAARKTALRYSQALKDIAADMALVITRGELGLTETLESKQLAEDDRMALLRVANWYENYIRALRRPNDPLMVAKHRGDPVLRGVHISIANGVLIKFGKRLDRTAMTLASVALGVNVGIRPARSALTKKPKRKVKPVNRQSGK